MSRTKKPWSSPTDHHRCCCRCSQRRYLWLGSALTSASLLMSLANQKPPAKTSKGMWQVTRPRLLHPSLLLFHAQTVEYSYKLEDMRHNSSWPGSLEILEVCLIYCKWYHSIAALENLCAGQDGQKSLTYFKSKHVFNPEMGPFLIIKKSAAHITKWFVISWKLDALIMWWLHDGSLINHQRQPVCVVSSSSSALIGLACRWI